MAESPSQDQNPIFVHRAFSAIARRYVLTNHVLTLGIDLIWRRRVARIIRTAGATRILDVATGSGDLALAIRSALPQSHLIGVDFCAPMIAVAQQRGLTDLLVADGLHLPFRDATFDALTIGYGLRNIADWSAALHEFSRVLKPGGLLVVLDFSLPTQRHFRAVYRFYLHRILPRIAGFLTGHPDAYIYLGDSIERFPAGPAMCTLIEASGFDQAQATALCGGISSVYTARSV